MGGQDRPSFFCSRPDGTLTPLLAVDELPLTLSVRGVSRTLTPGDTQGMTSCGVAVPRTDAWVVDGAPSSPRTVREDKMNELHALLFKILRDEDVSSEVRSSIQEILFRGFDNPAPVPVPTPTPTGVVTVGQSPTGVPHFGYGGNVQGQHKNPPPNKKSFCSYWIRHGECDYSQQGCLYKHEMPMDLDLLDRLGLRDIPRWYREKFGVSSLLQTGYGNNRAQHQLTFTENVSQPAHQPAQRAIEWSAAAESVENSERRPKQSRYKPPKSPRGPGFQPGKNRGNYSKGQQPRNGYINPYTLTPTGSNSTPSPEPSDSSDSFILAGGTSKASNATNAADITRVLARQNLGHVPSLGEHLLDKEGMHIMKYDPTARMAKQLDPKEPIGGYPNSKGPFRTKSRRPYEFGGDSQLKTPGTDNAAARPSTAGSDRASKVANTGAPNVNTEKSRTMYDALMSDTSPIHPRDMEFTFGAIGEPVQYPSFDLERSSSNTSAQTSIYVGHQFFTKTDKKCDKKNTKKSDN